MGEQSKIEWTDATWTPIRAHILTPLGDGDGFEVGRAGWHCEHVSEGCRNCYAEGMNRRLGTGLPYKPGPLKGKRVQVFLDQKMLRAPLRWKRPRRIFVCSMTDLFADFVQDEWIDAMFAVMSLAPRHIYQILTKRPARMRTYMQELYSGGRRTYRQAKILAPKDETDTFIKQVDFLFRPPPNIWLGTSAEDQATAAARIPLLLDTQAAIRFLSAEPLLGPIDLVDSKGRSWRRERSAPSLDWVIAGGESGPGARPMHPDWALRLRDQCASAGVPFFFKQWGEWGPIEQWSGHQGGGKFRREIAIMDDGSEVPHDAVPQEIGGQRFARLGKKRAGRLLDGVEHNAMPALSSGDAG